MGHYVVLFLVMNPKYKSHTEPEGTRGHGQDHVCQGMTVRQSAEKVSEQVPVPGSIRPWRHQAWRYQAWRYQTLAAVPPLP